MNRFELADAMIRGLHTPNVKEDKRAYVHISEKSGFCKACALGCALIGFYDGDYVRAEQAFDGFKVEDDEYDVFAKLLEIPTSLTIEIEHKHLNGMPIQQIAAWLKSSEGGEHA